MIFWEEIKQEQAGYLYRAKVPNGWLVKEVQDVGNDYTGKGVESGYFWTSSLVFVPDVEHKWRV